MATAIDPICAMDVDTDNPPGGESEYQGTTYYFCAPGCKVAFDKEPEKYLGEEDAEGAEGAEGAESAEPEGHDDHEGHDHGHSHEGHHMPESKPESQPDSRPASRPGFFARLFGKK